MSYGYLLINDWQTEDEIHNAISQLQKRNIHYIIGDVEKSQPHFQQLLKKMKPGTILLVPSMSHLGSDFEQIKANIITLTKKRIQLHLIDAPFLDFSIYEEPMQHRLQTLFLQMIDYISKYDEQKTRQKQRMGIEIAKQNGSYKGRKKWYTESSANEEKRKVYQNIIHMLSENYSITQIHKETGVSRTTIYRIRDDHFQS